MRRVRVARLDDVPQGTMRMVQVDGTDILPSIWMHRSRNAGQHARTSISSSTGAS